MLGSHIDLFILDISMPQENGLSLASFIREQDPSTSIIMLSADAEEQHLNKNEPKAYDAYIVKPMSNQTLLLEVTQQLNLTWSYETKPDKMILDGKNVMSQVGDVVGSKQAVTKAPKELMPLLKELKAHLDIGHSKGVRNVLAMLQKNEWPGEETLFIWLELAKAYQYIELAEQINHRIGDEH